MNIYKVHARFLAFFVNKLVEPLISRDSVVSKVEKSGSKNKTPFFYLLFFALQRLRPDFRFANSPGRMKILQKKLHSGFVIDNAF